MAHAIRVRGPILLGALTLASVACAPAAARDTTSDAGAPDVATGLPKAAFVAKADAVCARFERTLQSLDLPDDLRSARRYARRGIVAFEDALVDLYALDPPRDDRATVDEILAAWDRAVGHMRDGVRAAFLNDADEYRAAWRNARREAGRGDSLAVRYGLKRCGDSSRSRSGLSA